MASYSIKFKKKDIQGFERAIQRHPVETKMLTHDMFVDIMAEYNRGIIRHPWRIGGQGGGAPVNVNPNASTKGNLRDSHERKIYPWKATIKPNSRQAPYAEYVHEGTYKMEKRPWLDYVFNTKMRKVERIIKRTFDKIVNNLAK